VLRDRLHVLLRIDPEKTGPARRILPVRKQDMDFPMSWIRRQGAGRVFYTGLGHGAEVFSNPQILQHLLAGIQYALGDLSADDSPDGTRRRRALHRIDRFPEDKAADIARQPVVRGTRPAGSLERRATDKRDRRHDDGGPGPDRQAVHTQPDAGNRDDRRMRLRPR
jgi:hypothetical protein